MGAVDEDLDERRVRLAPEGEAAHVLERLLAGVGDARLGGLPVQGRPDDPAGDPRSAADHRRLLEDEHLGARVVRGRRGAQPGGAAAHHDDVDDAVPALRPCGDHAVSSPPAGRVYRAATREAASARSHSSCSRSRSICLRSCASRKSKRVVPCGSMRSRSSATWSAVGSAVVGMSGGTSSSKPVFSTTSLGRDPRVERLDPERALVVVLDEDRERRDDPHRPGEQAAAAALLGVQRRALPGAERHLLDQRAPVVAAEVHEDALVVLDDLGRARAAGHAHLRVRVVADACEVEGAGAVDLRGRHALDEAALAQVDGLRRGQEAPPGERAAVGGGLGTGEVQLDRGHPDRVEADEVRVARVRQLGEHVGGVGQRRERAEDRDAGVVDLRRDPADHELLDAVLGHAVSRVGASRATVSSTTRRSSSSARSR